jgi:polyhydroxyalkanoate synthesis regulator phasin
MGDSEQITTPMLETLLERINALTTETRELRILVEKGFAEIREEMNQGFRKIDRRLDVMSGDINKLRADMNYLETKIEKLEREPA